MTTMLREAEVKRQVYALLRGLGCHILDLSQYRPSRVALGLPDAVVFLPFSKGMAWYEAKRPGGKQRPEQRVFQERCEAAGVPYILGGKVEVETFLREARIL